MADEQTREFVDRALRERLERPENLAELLQDTIPDVAPYLDFSQMRPADREFLVGNFRERESDLLFEIPYRRGDQQTPTLICVLVEHQSKTDWLIPLKTFIYASLYWEWQWRTWDKAPVPKVAFQPTLVLPVVFFTGLRPWGSVRNFRELFTVPEELRRYLPDWQPLFWELERHPAEQLLQQPALFLQSLAMLTAEDRDFAEATRLFQSIVTQAEPMYEQNHSRWSEQMRFLLGYSHNKRPHEERSQWHQFALQLLASMGRLREIEAMGKTIAQSYIDEGKEIGKAIGEGLGFQKGAVSQAREILIRFASRRLNAPDDATRHELEAIADVERLHRMLDQHAEVATWADLLAIE